MKATPVSFGKITLYTDTNKHYGNNFHAHVQVLTKDSLTGKTKDVDYTILAVPSDGKGKKLSGSARPKVVLVENTPGQEIVTSYTNFMNSLNALSKMIYPDSPSSKSAQAQLKRKLDGIIRYTFANRANDTIEI
jgi:hypothetical protein